VDEIELDPAAETSTNLLRCLLAEGGLSPRLILTSTSSVVEARVPTRRNNLRLRTAASRPNSARLLIGDQAIHFRERHPDFEFWDLGEQWNKLVGLPFVYALWLVRPEVVDPKPIANRLRGLRDENLAGIDELIAEEKEFDRNFCRRYYREHLRFGFREEERAGLREFHKRCLEQRLLPREYLEAGACDSRLPFRGV
jgi:predicted solute-binding protein